MHSSQRQTTLPEIRALRLELLTDPDLALGRAGQIVERLCALTEFHVEVSNAEDEQQKKSGAKFQRVTADFANDRIQLDPQFGDKEGKRGFTGRSNMR